MHCFTATKEEMELKMLSKRTPIPRINASDVEETDSEEAAAAKKTAKQVPSIFCGFEIVTNQLFWLIVLVESALGQCFLGVCHYNHFSVCYRSLRKKRLTKRLRKSVNFRPCLNGTLHIC